MIGRRDFITFLGAAAAAWPLAARAQQPELPVIGYLEGGSPAASYTGRILAAFQQGLNESGYTPGRNVAIEYRWAEGRYDRLPGLAADLVRRHVTVIIASGGPAALSAKAATTTIPIVFLIGVDPVESGLVRSLSRPGGNLTGVTSFGGELGPKRLELLHELVPAASAFGLLINPTRSSAEKELKEVQAAAGKLGLQLQVLHAAVERELDAAFASLTALRLGGLVIGGDPFFNSQTEQLATLTVRKAVPAIYQSREFAAAGGLASFGSGGGNPRLVGVYTGRILKGEKPADLPIQQATTKLELIINLKTAKALGLTAPLSLLASADEVIE
jgi:putative ABC transport system substrate-binding protein